MTIMQRPGTARVTTISAGIVGVVGHWAKDCRQPRRSRAFLAKAEEDDEEPALLMAQVPRSS